MLYPKFYYRSVFDVNYETLKAKGFTAIVFDIDNTLVPFDVPKPTEEVLKLFDKLKQMGFAVGLLSNNGKERVSHFNEDIRLPNVYKAKKPGKKGILRLLALLNAAPSQAILIGDQIFTDVVCANNAGLVSVLVQPVSGRDEISVKWKRSLEKIVLSAYKKHCKTDN